jgi:23S rRNA-/tRNA-specific pseudouridylate synthase
MTAGKSDSDMGFREFNVGFDDDGIRLDRWFKRHLPDTSYTTVAMWARTGQLRVDGARATPGDRIAAGQMLRVPPAEADKATADPDKPKRVRERVILSDEETELAQGMVIHKDFQAFVLNKPPGLATQGGTKTTQHVDGLLDALQYDNEGRPKLVHRLDKDTSGALLVARTSRAAAFFAKAFSGRTARKVYWALVVDVPSIEDGMIELPIGHRWREDAHRRGRGRTGADAVPRDRACGQPRGVGRVAAVYGADAPVARAYGGDRASDRRRRQIRWGGGVSDRWDLAENASACAADQGGSSGWRVDRRDRWVADAFRGEPEAIGLRGVARRCAGARREDGTDARAGEVAGQGAC